MVTGIIDNGMLAMGWIEGIDDNGDGDNGDGVIGWGLVMG